MSIVRIRGFVKNYAWGNSDFIPSLVGEADGRPQAEYWMGTHPNGQAVLSDGRMLSGFIGHNLKYLFKILAIENPLAIQCHPNTLQAREGWKREEALRAEGKPHNYQDPNQKAEAFIALTPVSAMCGFLPLSSIRNNLRTTIPSSWKLIEPFLCDHWKLYSGLYALSEKEKKTILSELRTNVLLEGETSMFTIDGVIRKCLELYPDDIGCLFPLLMNMVYLQPGEGVFLQMGVLHAYCYGNGIEIMTNSDNVLRGGLTHMRMDLDELARIAVFDQYDARKCRTIEDSAGRREYIFPVDDFRLTRIEDGQFCIKGETEAVGLVVDGSIEIESEEGLQTFDRGESFYIPENTAYTVRSQGSAYFARG